MFKRHLDKIRRLTPQKMEQDLLIILKQSEAEATEMITDQLESGHDALGNELPEYSPVSVNVFGKRPGPWTLHDTGDFYKGIFMDAGRWPVLFDSKDSKTDSILTHVEKKGGNADEILALDSSHKKELSIILRKKTEAYFKSFLL